MKKNRIPRSHAALREAAESLLDHAQGPRPTIGSATSELRELTKRVAKSPLINAYLDYCVPCRSYMLERGGDSILGIEEKHGGYGSMIELIRKYPQEVALILAGFLPIAVDAGGDAYAISSHDDQVYLVTGALLPHADSLDCEPEGGPISEQMILEEAENMGDLVDFLQGLKHVAENGYPP